MKNKKGVTLVGEIIAFLFLIATGYFLTGANIYAYGVSAVTLELTQPLEYVLDLEGGYMPLANEMAVLSLLESKYNDLPIKTIVTQCLIQNTNDPKIDGASVDAELAIQDILDQWQINENRDYVIRIKSGSNTIPIIGENYMNTVETSGVVNFQKIETKIFSPFANGQLEVYIFEDY